jgi:hypothetical protein
VMLSGWTAPAHPRSRARCCSTRRSDPRRHALGRRRRDRGRDPARARRRVRGGAP